MNEEAIKLLKIENHVYLFFNIFIGYEWQRNYHKT